MQFAVVWWVYIVGRIFGLGRKRPPYASPQVIYIYKHTVAPQVIYINTYNGNENENGNGNGRHENENKNENQTRVGYSG